ncbi:CdaR family protein [Paenibacillus sp. TRM 82003]|nr:CdaR family protein [Paenibacillus sp. TRM 82003]
MDNWLRNNMVIRIVAVLLAVVLWVVIRLDMQTTKSPAQATTVSQTNSNVEINVVGLDEDRFTLLSVEPRRVSLTIIGTVSALRKVNIEQDYQVTLDLSDALPGETLMPLRYSGFPSNVEVVLDPPNVLVSLDEKQRKEVPVTINTIGSPADGFTAGEPIVQPNRVNVVVESSLADEVASVVGLIDIDGATESVKQQVKLAALNANGTELDLEIAPAVVDVEVPITSPFKTMPLQVQLEGSSPPGYAVSAVQQSASEVTVYAPQAYLNSLEFYDGLRVDLTTHQETKTFEFEVPVKEGVERVEPSTVSVTVTIVPAETVAIEAVPLTMNGMSEDYEYRFVTPEVGELDVPVEAAPEVIRDLDAEDVRAFVDVSNLPPGTYEVPVNYTLPSFVDRGEDVVANVTVEVSAKSEEASVGPEPPANDGAAVEPGTEPGAEEAPAAEGAGAGEGPATDAAADATDGVGADAPT